MQTLKAWKLLCYEWKCPACGRYNKLYGPLKNPKVDRCLGCNTEFVIEAE